MKRTLLVALAGCSLLGSALLARPAQAQSAEELRKWAEDARRQMQDEFNKARGELDQLRRDQEQRLQRLQDGIFRKLDEMTGRAPAQPAQPQAGDSRAWLGVSVSPIDDGMRAMLDIPEGAGVLVRSVVDGSPASSVLQAYDVIISIDGKNVATPQDVGNAIAAKKAGESISVAVLRESKKQTLTVKLGARPADGGAQPSPVQPSQPDTQPAPARPQGPVNPDALRRDLDRAFRDGNQPDPAPEQGNPLLPGMGNGQNPFGEGGGALAERLQDMMRQLQENPGQLQGLMEQLRERMQGRNPLQPGQPGQPGQGDNPLQEQLDQFLRGLEGNNPAQPPATPAPAVRPWLGLSGTNPNDAMQAAGATGVVITRVNEGGPAEKAGLQRGDIVIAINGKPVRHRDDMKEAIDASKVGDKLTIKYLRDGKEATAELTVEGR